MNQKNAMARGSMGRKKQKGISLISILIAVIIGAALTVAAIRAAQGQRGDVEFNAGVQFVTADVQTALTGFFDTHGKSYKGLGGSAATVDATVAKATLTNKSGLDPAMPWGDDWTVKSRDAAGTTVVITFGCSNLRAGCTELQQALNSLSSASSMMTAAALEPATSPTGVSVTYKRPQ